MSKIGAIQKQTELTPEGKYTLVIAGLRDVEVEDKSKRTPEAIKNDEVPLIVKSVLTGTINTGKVIQIYSDKSNQTAATALLPSFHERLLSSLYTTLKLNQPDLDTDDTAAWNTILTKKKVTVYCVHYIDKATGAVYENYYLDATDKRVRAMLKQAELLRK